MNRIIAVIIAVCVVPTVSGAAQYTIDTDSSSLSFVSVKNGDAAVPGAIPGVSGQVQTNKGTLSGTMDIDLATLDTGNPGRDHNITSVFFKVADTGGTARFEIQGSSIDVATLAEPGQSAAGTVDGQLTLNSVTADVRLHVRAARQADSTIRVTTIKPATVRFGEFDLSAAASALKQICGHAELLGLATVSGDLLLRPDPGAPTGSD